MCTFKLAYVQHFRFNVQPVEELTEGEMEIYETDVAIPVQLRS